MEILHRFGGFYLDGDDVLTGDPEGSEQSLDIGFAVVQRSDGFDLRLGNSAVTAARGHPLTRLWVDVIEDNYRQSQHRLLPEDTSHDPADRDPQNLVHRRSVMFRTGPYTLFDLLDRVGLANVPALPGVQVRSAGSWRRPPSGGPRPRVTVDDLDGTVDLTARVVTVLLRQLENRSGDLHLPSGAGLVARHAEPVVVWRAALEFLAGMVGDRVTSVTYGEPGAEERVVLPPAAADLVVETGESPMVFLGEEVVPARLGPVTGAAEPRAGGGAADAGVHES